MGPYTEPCERVYDSIIRWPMSRDYVIATARRGNRQYATYAQLSAISWVRASDTEIAVSTTAELERAHRWGMLVAGDNRHGISPWTLDGSALLTHVFNISCDPSSGNVRVNASHPNEFSRYVDIPAAPHTGAGGYLQLWQHYSITHYNDHNCVDISFRFYTSYSRGESPWVGNQGSVSATPMEIRARIGTFRWCCDRCSIAEL